ncbi:hypothetical protein C8J56DRAFT_1041515 [Mycena floridula]|nr:hypothetical protein C8J56DRAFT_1041515 [Mycena floridula]
MTLGLLEIESAARAAFKAVGLPACLVGSCACVGNGTKRTPNDVDLMILDAGSGVGIEEIKNSIVSSNSNFFLTRSQNPLATYQILWFKFSDTIQVRIDILAPGMIDLPPIRPDHLENSPFLSELPVMPFLPALLHKVLAWKAHGNVGTEHGRFKQANDVQDISDMLQLAWKTSRDSWIQEARRLELPIWFLDLAEHAVKEFLNVSDNEHLVDSWKHVGFN